MYKSLAAHKNIIRTKIVFYVFQNCIFKNRMFLVIIGMLYGLFHAKQLYEMNRYLLKLESTNNSKSVIGNSTGSGGTSRIANCFTEWLSEQVNTQELELFSGSKVIFRIPAKDENTSMPSECYVIDSKIALICVFLYKYEHLKVNLFTWNQSDFSFYFSKFLSDRKNVFLVDYLARKNRTYFDWNEEIIFEALGDNKIIPGEIRRKSEVHFIGRLTFQKGIDRFLRLAHQNSTIRFNIYGDGPLHEHVSRKKTSNVYMHGFRHDPFTDISTDDLLIVPSRYFEGVPLVLLEAIQRRIRVISSGVGDLSMVESELHFTPKTEVEFLEFSDTLIKRVVSSDN